MDRRPPDTKRTDPLFPYTTRVRSEAARERLAQAHKALQAAERELVEAREAFFRAKARQEALEKRRDSWRGEQRALEARQEEDITADLLMARSEEHTSELQSLMRISYAVFCLKKKNTKTIVRR